MSNVLEFPEGSKTFQCLALQLTLIERGGRTLRCHTVPHLQPQSVAAHTYGVAWLCWLFSNEKPSAALLLAAMAHDMPECETGDIPAPTKRTLKIRETSQDLEDFVMDQFSMPKFPLTTEEARILKVADVLELAQYCVRERSMGNRNLQMWQMYQNALLYAKEVVKTDLEKKVINHIENTWGMFK
jgi:5'-deoxynucleotidase YfbR-like HD superfamily hydrolase